MIPMVFWASLPPCPSEQREADTNCSHRNVVSTTKGVVREKSQETIGTSRTARNKPMAGGNMSSGPA